MHFAPEILWNKSQQSLEMKPYLLSIAHHGEGLSTVYLSICKNASIISLKGFLKNSMTQETWKLLLDQHEAGQRLTEFYQENSLIISKHPLPTKQEKTLHMDLTRWPIPKSDWLYSLQPKMEKLYTVSKNKTGSWLWRRSWTPYCQIQT